MKKESNKEILTLEKIKIDMINVIRSEIKYILYALTLSLIPIVLILIVSGALDIFGIIKYFILSVGAVYGCVLLVFYGLRIYRAIDIFTKIKKNNFEIEDDKLISLENKKPSFLLMYNIGYSSARLLNKPYRLLFSRGREYEIAKTVNYSWSKIFHMNDIQIFNSSNINDEFYLAILNETIVCIYNKKFFEYK